LGEVGYLVILLCWCLICWSCFLSLIHICPYVSLRIHLYFLLIILAYTCWAIVIILEPKQVILFCQNWYFWIMKISKIYFQ